MTSFKRFSDAQKGMNNYTAQNQQVSQQANQAGHYAYQQQQVPQGYQYFNNSPSMWLNEELI